MLIFLSLRGYTNAELETEDGRDSAHFPKVLNNARVTSTSSSTLRQQKRKPSGRVHGPAVVRTRSWTQSVGVESKTGKKAQRRTGRGPCLRRCLHGDAHFPARSLIWRCCTTSKGTRAGGCEEGGRRNGKRLCVRARVSIYACMHLGLPDSGAYQSPGGEGGAIGGRDSPGRETARTCLPRCPEARRTRGPPDPLWRLPGAMFRR